MLHMPSAMLDSFSKTMSRSGLMSPFNSVHKSSGGNVSSSGGSSTLSRSSLGSNMSGNKTFSARVVFLDDTCQTFDVDKRAKGQYLVDTVFRHLDIGEKEYFGLMFNDTGADNVPDGHAPDIMRWLDPNKLIRKQVRIIGGQKAGMTPVATLYFRVKFYVTDPSRLKEEFTRYQVYMQVKKDISEGRLSAPLSTICLLTSYVVQSTLGDFDLDTCRSGYLSAYYDLRKHSTQSLKNEETIPDEEMDRRVTELHKLHKNQSPGEAEMNFLEHAKRLEMYGIALHPGKDSHGRAIQLGVTCIGLVVFQNAIKINTFSWSKIVKISFKRKQFFIQLRKELTESYDTLLGFNLANYRSCKNLWKSAVEHHSFFRLHAPPHSVQQNRGRSMTPPSSNGARKFLTLSLGSKFRYSGRNEFKTTPEKKDTKEFSRLSTFRKTLPLHLEPVAVTTTDQPDKSSSRPIARLASPETSSIGSSVHSHNGGLKPKLPMAATPNSVVAGQQQQQPPKRGQKDETQTNSSSHSSSHQSLAHRAIESFNNKVQSLSSKLPKKAWQEDPTSDDEGGFLETRPINSLNKVTNKRKSTTNTMFTATVTSSTPPLNNHTSLCLSDSPSASDRTNSSHSGFKGSGSIHSNGTLKLTPVSLKLPIGPAATTVSAATAGPMAPSINSAHSSPMNGRQVAIKAPNAPNELESSDNSLVLITIYPDEHGRFGFNVKGGVDQKMPIIVSRVGANTPADKCLPRLNEGDQVIMINGRDISQHTHDQVVNFIRASSEPHSAQLELAVRQNAYMGEAVEEPEFQYVPDTPHVSPLVPGTQAVSMSMHLLEESLDSGAICGQFEQLYRRNTGLSMTICSMEANFSKNRYRDISPYDSTRVVLTDCPGGDYINANHVVMTIPGSGIINRYIATQGPLATTCTDFWYMTWECQSTLIIMLTTIVERGRIKCHKYWPDVGDTIEYGVLAVTCINEDIRENFTFREFSIQHKETEDVRQVTQMAYSSWPDHGVPESSEEFVDFVENVRSRRKGSMEPTIVHCSAGIGRTGVVILMETALYLIEANQPVYPLDLTRVMRDQRASMIQTPSQYKFVCQAILKVYKEGQVKPLPEFCQTTATSVSVLASSTDTPIQAS